MKKITNNFNIKALLVFPVLVMFLFASFELKAQDTINSEEEEWYELEEECCIHWSEIEPEFPGGNDSLNAFIKQNLQYPKSAKEQGIEGTAWVRFIIEKDGSVTLLSINKDLNEELAAEAIRLVNMLPKWKPGYVGPKPVRVCYTLPIVFKLDKE